eukprot:UN10033
MFCIFIHNNYFDPFICYEELQPLTLKTNKQYMKYIL